MKTPAYVGAVLGLAALIVLAVRADLAAMLRVLSSGGLALLWLIPYRALFFILYAIGWSALLRPNDPAHRAGLGYMFWATIVRDAVDRMLPVASVGGSLVGVRILHWRGIPGAAAAASVIIEILLTLVALYLFTALGLMLLAQYGGAGHDYRRVLIAFVLSLPVPVVTAILLKNGSILKRLQALIHSWAGAGAIFKGTGSLDREIRASLGRPPALLIAGGLQFVALLSGAFEIWFALRLFDHPVSPGAALMLESMTQAVRHLAFVVPAGLGVQEAGLVLFGHIIGVSGDMALAVGLVKRMREIAWGVPTLVSWQWLEGRRLRRA
ncbi:MAG TPA: lysylphosphatidylglycerol synthase domain-containing protein [Steroidobacteraceae bacterium]|nr:lysylphosphatidylglycerol synthase domain-containing protein [Steroidobacteraceae bacterium]